MSWGQYHKSDCYFVYTNRPVGGLMRGFGMHEIQWRIDQFVDRLAEQRR